MDHNDIEMTDLEGEQREIAECIGIDAYRTLAQTYGGSSIYIAKTASILKDERDRRIRREYNGCNAHALAIKYDLADNTVHKIVRGEKQRIENKPTDDQLPLFKQG